MKTSLKRVPTTLASVATAIALVLGYGLAAPAAYAAPSASAKGEAGQDLTAKDIELIDGLLFGIGPAAKEFGNSIDTLFSDDELVTVQGYIESTRTAFVDAKSTEVKAAVDELRSGSVNSTQAGIDGLSGAFNEHISETYTAEELENAVETVGDVQVVPMCGAVAACAAAVVVVVYAGAIVHNAAAITAAGAVVVSVYLWCGAWVGCGRAAASSGEERVQEEKFLANATRVGASYPQ
ncbi:MAG TPA: hypothetical protein VNJ54_17620 [Plantibacter sp.]|uniref:hypothetical protein n=1 Tax=unclassified Plantibacter TaxID=2624265 RepID=UPI002B7FCA26|nr:hypothetical protein [Plantibacter sp.]